MISFSKYQATGNDFILVNEIESTIVDKKAAFARSRCERRKSVGADGVIFACKSENADVRMRIFNSDGSEAQMCGNGIRCLTQFLHDLDIVKVISPKDLFGHLCASHPSRGHHLAVLGKVALDLQRGPSSKEKAR